MRVWVAFIGTHIEPQMPGSTMRLEIAYCSFVPLKI